LDSFTIILVWLCSNHRLDRSVSSERRFRAKRRGPVVNTFIFGKSRFQISARRQAIRIDGFRGFLRTSMQVSEQYLELGHGGFLPDPFQFIVHLSPILSTLNSSESLKKRR
jgi:hypothetical protein